ncbi:hypothetical protein [Hyphomonas sp.]|uniref:hypothetical protein n=1 Tax=Hyphomonas sp. TaxID=87 RepID=UPI0025C56717|nr:hypothetical protein [Hyphomonas sp.]
MSMVRNAVLGLIAFLVLWFVFVGFAWEHLYPGLRTSGQMPADAALARPAAVEAEFLPTAADARAQDEAMFAEAKILAKELSAEPYMQPPFVSEVARDGLAFRAALAIVVGQCTRADYDQWGWGQASLPGRAGQYFTYCDNGGKPQIVYMSPT